MAETVGYPRKRTQTRNRLIRAGLTVIAASGPDAATVGAIAAEAGVAPGTFYNHFPALTDLVDDITGRLGSGVEIGSELLSVIENEPPVRVAIGVLQLLDLAEVDGVAAAAFVTLIASKPDFRARIRGIVMRVIDEGAASGRFDVVDLEASTNAVVGTTMQSIRSRLMGETDAGSAPEVARLVLRLLGVDASSALDSVEAATASMRSVAMVGAD